MASSIGVIVRDAIAFDPKERGGVEEIRSTAEALLDELERAGVEYVLVGGVALLSYVEGRNTQDVDLIVSPGDLERMSWRVGARDADFARADYHGVRVDLLLTSNRLFDEVRTRDLTFARFGDRQVRCATPEGLLVLKLYALPSLYRTGQLARAALYETDVLMLHQGRSVDDESLLARLAPHLPGHDVAELRRILDEQRTRSRFR